MNVKSSNYNTLRHIIAFLLLVASCVLWLRLSFDYHNNTIMPFFHILATMCLGSALFVLFFKMNTRNNLRLFITLMSFMSLVVPLKYFIADVFDREGFFERIKPIKVGMRIENVYAVAKSDNIVTDKEYLDFVGGKLGDRKRVTVPKDFTGSLVIVPFVGTIDSCSVTVRAGRVSALCVTKD